MPFLSRAASLQDSNPRSRTFGCCDRAFWQYRTLTGFSAATCQQLALPFAIAHARGLPGGDWRDRARAAVLWWCRIQHADGSFDEWYRNEHSYCPTAFTTFGMAESLLLLRPELAADDCARIVEHLRRAAAWLAPRFNPEVMNQNLAACAAQWAVYRSTGADEFARAVQQTWRRTLRSFDEEGWFVEYGGADLGYATLALDILALLHRRGFEEDVLGVARRAAAYLSSFICPGGGLAPRLGSRGTQHAFPFGAEYFASMIPDAARLAQHVRDGVARNQLSSPAVQDDRYFAYFYLPQFMLAAVEAPASLPVVEFPRTDTNWHRSGFAIRHRPGADLVVSGRRQGAFCLYRGAGPARLNAGYWAEAESGARYSSGFWNESPEPDWVLSPDVITTRGRFVRLDDSLPLARGAAPFHAFTEYVLRWPRLAERVQALIKQRKIRRRELIPLAFERTIRWTADALEITDTFTAEPGCPPIIAISPTRDVDVHSPSARVEPAPADAITADEAAARDNGRRFTAAGSLVLTTRIPLAPTTAWPGGLA